jgi:hypothetical protein
MEAGRSSALLLRTQIRSLNSQPALPKPVQPQRLHDVQETVKCGIFCPVRMLNDVPEKCVRPDIYGIEDEVTTIRRTTLRLFGVVVTSSVPSMPVRLAGRARRANLYQRRLLSRGKARSYVTKASAVDFGKDQSAIASVGLDRAAAEEYIPAAGLSLSL